jgi:hypothetical protein
MRTKLDAMRVLGLVQAIERRGEGLPLVEWLAMLFPWDFPRRSAAAADALRRGWIERPKGEKEDACGRPVTTAAGVRAFATHDQKTTDPMRVVAFVRALETGGAGRSLGDWLMLLFGWEVDRVFEAIHYGTAQGWIGRADEPDAAPSGGAAARTGERPAGTRGGAR